MFPRKLHLRCTIDGLDVPIVSVSATFQEGAAATGQITLVPTDELHDLEGRAHVAVYVYDGADFDFGPDNRTRVRLGGNDPRRWKLLLDGEYLAMSYTKNEAQRQAVMVISDVTTYFDSIRQHYVNFGNAGIELYENAFMGVRMDRLQHFDVVTKGAYCNLYVWLHQSKGPNGKPNLYMGAHRVLREAFFAANDFYVKMFNRLRIGDRLVGIPTDETAAKLMDLQFFEKFVKDQIGGAGGMVSLRDMLTALLQPVFHTHLTVPFPMLDRKGTALGFAPSPATRMDKALADEIIDRSKSWPGSSLNQVIIKPDAWFLFPPACNIVFPDQHHTLQFQRSIAAEPTRLFLRTSLLFTGQDKWLTERFYAPDFDAFNDSLYATGGYLDRLASRLVPHEAYVGMNPAMLWEPDLAAYVAKGPRREYLSKVADYTYWKLRFGSRTLSVQGPLNLNVVPGYPILVLDKPGMPGRTNRSFIGNLQAVTHVVDQNGGSTSLHVVGARVHDEIIDFDREEGEPYESLEDIATRGTDGFLDERYHKERIGPEVYQTLFGCGSLYDLYQKLVAEEIYDEGDDVTQRLKDIEQEKGTMTAAVEALSILYRNVVRNSKNVPLFIEGITARPKASLPELAGTNFTSFQADDGMVLNVEQLGAVDPDLVANEGWVITALDPSATTTKDASFVANKRRQVAQVTTTEVPAVKTNDGYVISPQRLQSSVSYTVVEKGTQANYQLASHLKGRQAKVLAYLLSIREQGIRG